MIIVFDTCGFIHFLKKIKDENISTLLVENFFKKHTIIIVNSFIEDIAMARTRSGYFAFIDQLRKLNAFVFFHESIRKLIDCEENGTIFHHCQNSICSIQLIHKDLKKQQKRYYRYTKKIRKEHNEIHAEIKKDINEMKQNLGNEDKKKFAKIRKLFSNAWHHCLADHLSVKKYLDEVFKPELSDHIKFFKSKLDIRSDSDQNRIITAYISNHMNTVRRNFIIDAESKKTERQDFYIGIYATALDIYFSHKNMVTKNNIIVISDDEKYVKKLCALAINPVYTVESSDWLIDQIKK